MSYKKGNLISHILALPTRQLPVVVLSSFQTLHNSWKAVYNKKNCEFSHNSQEKTDPKI